MRGILIAIGEIQDEYPAGGRMSVPDFERSLSAMDLLSTILKNADSAEDIFLLIKQLSGVEAVGVSRRAKQAPGRSNAGAGGTRWKVQRPPMTGTTLTG